MVGLWKRMAILAGIMVLLGLAEATVHAGNETGQVTSLDVRIDGLIYFELSGTHTGRPSCATNFEYWMIDERTAVGQRQYMMLLAAVQSGRTLTAIGNNTCNRWPDGEDVSDLIIMGP